MGANCLSVSSVRTSTCQRKTPSSSCVRSAKVLNICTATEFFISTWSQRTSCAYTRRVTRWIHFYLSINIWIIENNNLKKKKERKKERKKKRNQAHDKKKEIQCVFSIHEIENTSKYTNKQTDKKIACHCISMLKFVHEKTNKQTKIQMNFHLFIKERCLIVPF